MNKVGRSLFDSKNSSGRLGLLERMGETMGGCVAAASPMDNRLTC